MMGTLPAAVDRAGVSLERDNSQTGREPVGLDYRLEGSDRSPC
jgi:hypothetical protein